MQAGTLPRVLIVEDNATTARTLALFLREAGMATVHAAAGRDALDLLDTQAVGLVLLDLNLPDIDGLDLCRRIRARHDAPIVMLTARSSEDDIVTGLEAGAQDYVCKPFGARELVARVRRALRDSGLAPDTLLEHGDLRVDRERRTATLAGAPVTLTRSEFDLLATLMARPGRVLTRAQLIELALGEDFDGFDRTIDTHIWSIRKKLGDSRADPRFIFSELGVGYRFADA